MRAGVAEVVVYVDEPLLSDGLEVIDTPGVGSVHSHVEHTTAALQDTDAAIMVLTADPPISRSERELLDAVAETAVHTIVVINKADQLAPTGVATVLAFAEDQAVEVVGRRLEVIAASARDGLEAKLEQTPDPR